jgi:heme exporter protein B
MFTKVGERNVFRPYDQPASLDIGTEAYFCRVNPLVRQIGQLLALYWALEGRSRQLLSGVLLYVLVIVLVSSYIFVQPEGRVWLALYWMILLFAAVNTGVLSFMQESGGRRWYYYQIAGPVAVYLAKSLHVFFLLLLVAGLSGGLMTLIHGFPLHQVWPLLLSTVLAAAGLSLLFTLMAAMANTSRNSATLTTVLGFPLVIGLSMLAARIASGGLMSAIRPEDLQWDLAMLAGLDLLAGGMGILLFAYIWRD